MFSSHFCSTSFSALHLPSVLVRVLWLFDLWLGLLLLPCTFIWGEDHDEMATLELHRLEAACLPTNAASQGVLRKLGFKEEGYARKYLRINGEWCDHLLFGLIGADAGYPTTSEVAYE